MISVARLFAASAALVVLASSAEAQFTSVGGFDLRREGTDRELLYGQSPSGPGQVGAANTDGSGFHTNTFAPFRISYNATLGTMLFSWDLFNFGATYAINPVSNTFNAIQFNVRGAAGNGGVAIDNVTYNGLSLLGLQESGANNVFLPFGGVDASQDFEIEGDLKFGAVANPQGSAEAQRFSFRYGTIEGDFTSVPTSEVPEPTQIALMGLGLAGLAVAARRRQQTR